MSHRRDAIVGRWRQGCPVFALWLAWSCTTGDQTPVYPAQVDRILRDERYDWITVTTDHTRIHFPPGSFAADNRDVLPDRAEGSLAAILAALQEPEFTETLDLFYVDSRQDMENLTGRPVTGFAYFDDNAVVLVFNEDWRAFETHELTHVLTLGYWQPASGPAASEGLATWVDGDCGGYEVGTVTKGLQDDEGLIPFDLLTTEFRAQDDLVAYLQAAAVFEFAIRRSGRGVVRSLWDRGLAEAPDLLGIPRADFQSRFEDWLSDTYASIPPSALTAIRDVGCGINARRIAEREPLSGAGTP